jgi:general stress protein YciG
MPERRAQPRGKPFTPDRARAAGTLGGKARQATRAKPNPFEDPSVAEKAGRKGGAAVAQDREHMRELGRRSGAARRAKRRAA